MTHSSNSINAIAVLIGCSQHYKQGLAFEMPLLVLVQRIAGPSSHFATYISYLPTVSQYITHQAIRLQCHRRLQKV
jgi:hypothetical protein